MTVYRKIADSIDYLVSHHTEQPNLDHLARLAGYEKTHFQKLFSSHVGISPKRLMQYMNARRARELMEQGHSTLDSAYGAGLSGNGRLHDLFVALEGVHPGDIARRGQGVSITYGFHPTPLGELLVAQTGKGVCYLGFLMDQSRKVPIEKMKAHFPKASYIHNDEAVKAVTDQVLSIWLGRCDASQTLKLDIYGTNFQIQVWQALLKIPTGDTVTYQDVGKQLGRPKASRAVGNAVGANPVSLLIPCHRVIRKSGIIDNYGWGSPRKKLILAMENRLCVEG